MNEWIVDSEGKRRTPRSIDKGLDDLLNSEGEKEEDAQIVVPLLLMQTSIIKSIAINLKLQIQLLPSKKKMTSTSDTNQQLK